MRLGRLGCLAVSPPAAIVGSQRAAQANAHAVTPRHHPFAPSNTASSAPRCVGAAAAFPSRGAWMDGWIDGRRWKEGWISD
eukprot:scaffold223728_cov48-Prasinocladus_malaysianus.AAC.1